MKPKKLLALILALLLSLTCLAACGGNTPAGSDTGNAPAGSNGENAPGNTQNTPASSNGKGGKILFMSNMNSGPQYDAYIAYLDMIMPQLGYSYEVIFGDASNDPAGNLTAVKNSMTNDVVGLIISQDGGVAEIMAEYPDLYVAGFASDMAAVYGEGGTSAAAKTNDHFLGTTADQYVNGTETGKMYFDLVMAKGYKKVATIAFPPFAYPQLMVADGVFRGMVEEYNATAADADKVQVVGEPEVLMFQPLSDTYFMEAGRQDLDALIAPLDGCAFVYPALKNAISNGTVSANTKLVTSGFSTDSSLLADFGDEGVITGICVFNPETIIFPVVMLDNAIQGKQFSDYAASEALNSAVYVIDSKNVMDKVIGSSLLGTGDASKAVASWDTVKDLFVRNNDGATYQGLKDFLYSDTMTVNGIH